MPRPPKTYVHPSVWMHQHWHGGRDDGPTYVSLGWTDNDEPHSYMAWTVNGYYSFSLRWGFQPLRQYLCVRLDGQVTYEKWPTKYRSS